MILYLDAKNRIRSSENDWRLEREYTAEDLTVKWKARKFYSTLQAAVRGAFEEELRASPAEGVTEALAAAEKLLDKYTKALSPELTVVTR